VSLNPDLFPMNDHRQPRIEDLPLNTGVRVLASNEDGLVALDKPAGLKSHPNGPDDIERSLLTSSYDYQGEYFFWRDDDGAEQRVWLINRLDSPTSGVILIGMNEKISDTVKKQFATHRVAKFYFAIVRHTPRKATGQWSDMINKDVVNNRRIIKKARQVRAKADYQVVKTPKGGFPIALLRLAPITGRTHQLRVQCRKHGHPIVGDRTYGHFAFNKEVSLKTGEKRMMLHSSETVVNYTFNGKVRTFRAQSELPYAFSSLLRFRPGFKPTVQEVPAEDTETKESSLKDRRFKEA